MSTPDDGARHEHLRRYWDELVRGDPAPIPAGADLDPTLVETIRHLRALNDAAEPDPAFLTRLREDLMDTTLTTGSLPHRLTGAPNGRVPLLALPPQRWPTLARPARRRAWWLSQLATAALLLLTLGGIWLTFANRDQPAGVPPGQGTPSPATTAADVPMYRGNPARTGEMPGPGPDGQPVELWRAQTGGEVHSAPALVGGVLYVGSDDGNVYAFDAATGAERWRFATGGAVSSSPAVVAGMVHVANSAGDLVALDAATGAERWRFPGARDLASPVVVDGVVYIGSAEATFHALDAATGEERWRIVLEAPPSRSPAVGQGLVFFGTSDGRFYAVDVATGEERWRFQTPYATIPTPTVVDGTVYFLGQAGDGNDATLYAVDVASGSERWSFQTPTRRAFAPLAVAGGVVYAPGHDGSVYALDAATGAERWITPTGSPDDLASAPALAGGVLYVAGFDQTLYAFDAASGAERWRLTLDGGMDFGPIVASGVLYVGTTAGRVYAIGGSGDLVAGTPSAATPTVIAPDAASPAAGSAASVELVWETTGGPSPLNGPGGLAVDPEGNVHVIDTLNDRIQVFDRAGAFVATWGESGSGPGQFLFHRAEEYFADLAIDAQGNIYVFDTFNHRIQKFDPTRSFLLEWGSLGSANGQFNEPGGVVDGVTGLVYVNDYGNNRVQVFDANGQFLDKWGSGGTRDGQFRGPTDIAIDATGTIYVAEDDGNRIQRFDASGLFLGRIGAAGAGPGQFDTPIGLVVDDRNNLYVADYENHRIQVFGPDGTLLGIVDSVPGAGLFNLPIFLAIDPEGFLYVADEGNNRVLKLRLLPPLGP